MLFVTTLYDDGAPRPLVSALDLTLMVASSAPDVRGFDGGELKRHDEFASYERPDDIQRPVDASRINR